MIAIYEGWVNDFPIVSIEDPLNEEDWAGWSALMAGSATGSRWSVTTCSSPT